MRIFIALLVTVVLVGVAPVAVAAGFCAEQPCCPRSDELRVAAPDCCGDVACSNVTPEELGRTEQAKDVAALAPATNMTLSVVRPPSTPRPALSGVPARSAAERLSVLSILLI